MLSLVDTFYAVAGDEYSLFESVSGVLFWVSLCLTAVGTFLEFDGYQQPAVVGHVSTAVGGLIYVLNAAVAQHVFATSQLDCTLHRSACEPVEDNFLVAAFNLLVVDTLKSVLSPGALLPLLLAGAIGWGAAKLTKRTSATPGEADD